MADRQLRSAGELVAPAVAEMVKALDPPAEDAPLVALARSLASAIDGMAPAVRSAMMPQFSGQLVKVLGELDARARRRGTADPKRVSKLDELRATAARVRRPGA